MQAARFTAMASPCELLIETGDAALAARVGAIVAAEARRIEAKFSRYRPDSVVAELNRSAGRRIGLDAETA